MNDKNKRAGFTLIEMLVVAGIIGVLCSVTLPAIQRVRSSAQRISCISNMREIGKALHLHHGVFGELPPGMGSYANKGRFRFMGWQTRLLPFVEQDALWSQVMAAYAVEPSPFYSPPHTGLGTVVRLFACPADGRCASSQDYGPRTVALTSYLAINGTNAMRADGVFFRGSHTRFGEISDGLSVTLAVGERPPPFDFRYGWWYAGVGVDWRGTCDMLLGVNELNRAGSRFAGCREGPYEFAYGSPDDYCDVFHYWSSHYGGGPFLFCDGAVKMISYHKSRVLPAFASRAGGEVSLDVD